MTCGSSNGGLIVAEDGYYFYAAKEVSFRIYMIQATSENARNKFPPGLLDTGHMTI